MKIKILSLVISLVALLISILSYINTTKFNQLQIDQYRPIFSFGGVWMEKDKDLEVTSTEDGRIKVCGTFRTTFTNNGDHPATSLGIYLKYVKDKNNYPDLFFTETEYTTKFGIDQYIKKDGTANPGKGSFCYELDYGAKPNLQENGFYLHAQLDYVDAITGKTYQQQFFQGIQIYYNTEENKIEYPSYIFTEEGFNSATED